MRRELRAAVAAVVALLLAAVVGRPARAESPPPRAPLVFVADPKLAMETSVRTVDSLGRVVFRYEDALPEWDLGAHGVGRTVAYFGRVAKLFFFDEPIAELTATVTHEVGGHGARARELGLRPTYLFYLPGIYRLLFSAKEERDVGAFTSYETRGLLEGARSITGTLGGLEANYTHAWWINARIVRAQGWVHHGDLLAYATSKLPYVETFLSTSIEADDGDASDDVRSYITSLQGLSNAWRPGERRRIARRLRAGYLWNLVDPMLLGAAYGTLIGSLVEGRRTTQLPLPTVAGATLLVSPRFGLTPFGAEQILDIFLADRRGRMLDLYGRVGTSGLASYYGAGARLLGAPVSRRITAGGELDVWRQPEILLEHRGVFDPPMRLGMNAGLYGDVALTKELALTGKLAAKTPGYVMGQPLGGGLHGYLGVSLAWP